MGSNAKQKYNSSPPPLPPHQCFLFSHLSKLITKHIYKHQITKIKHYKNIKKKQRDKRFHLSVIVFMLIFFSLSHSSHSVSFLLQPKIQINIKSFHDLGKIIREERNIGRESRQISLYDQAVDEAYGFAAKVAMGYGGFIGIMSTFGGLTMTLQLYFGATMVLSGEISTGALTSYLLYVVQISGALGGLTGLAGQLMQAAGASSRVFELLDRV